MKKRGDRPVNEDQSELCVGGKTENGRFEEDIQTRTADKRESDGITETSQTDNTNFLKLRLMQSHDRVLKKPIALYK